ncbi:MAG: rhodanese-like domain-containing protein [Phycisphaerales bacterium JB050]
MSDIPYDLDLPADARFNPELEVSPAFVKRSLDECSGAIVLIDCREPDEYDHARIEGATLIPMGETRERINDIEDLIDDADDDDPEVIVYCHHGVRSLRVAAALRQMGIENARSMLGGIDLWSKQIDPSVPLY